MATKNPADNNPSQALEEQDRSIKARKTQLFDDSSADLATVNNRPFNSYLKTVPGVPLTSGQKALFWGLGIVVGLLFLAAILGGRR